MNQRWAGQTEVEVGTDGGPVRTAITQRGGPERDAPFEIQRSDTAQEITD